MKNRILFVEKNQDLSDILRIYLENHYYVGYASSDTDALTRLQKDEKIKLVIYHNEPPELDGLSFLKNIRKQHFSVPFILLSDESEVKEEVEIIRNTLFLHKHVEIDAMLQIIKTIIPEDRNSELRQYPRVNIKKLVVFYAPEEQKSFEGYVDNISLGGMRVQVNKEITEPDNTNLEFELFGKKVEINKMETVYTAQGKGNEKILGIKFSEMDNNHMRTIHDLISKIILTSLFAADKE